jgi:hypothetical protein
VLLCRLSEDRAQKASAAAESEPGGEECSRLMRSVSSGFVEGLASLWCAQSICLEPPCGACWHVAEMRILFVAAK